MIRLLVDENVPPPLIRALKQVEPGIDIVTVNEIGFAGRPDPEILAWADGEGRAVLTLDSRTMPGYVRERAAAGLPTSGIILLHRGYSLQNLLDDLHIVVCCLMDDELTLLQVQHVPI